ncbi:hypothetical protein C7M84_024584 [Penaeus vannamei]|uniref:Uncharacterized protein n=1 Tax=Penaeus vannamei TaxID=6689 RepID=A0A423U0M8_PENVA|nr:hypothetical protein C7M84_024584 [Penaeus vannamei]
MEGSSKSKMDMLDVAPPAVYLPPETMRTFAWLKGVPEVTARPHPSPPDAADSASGEGKKETLRQLVSRQMDSMSIGGLSHMWKASHPLFSFLWAVWSIGCLVLFVMDMNSILRHYFMYPVTISIANQKPSSLEVPAITICPKARVSCRGLAYAVINTSEDELKNISGNLFDKAKCCGAVKNLDEFAEYLNELGCAMDILAAGSLFPGFVTTPENLNEEFEELIQQLNVTERRKILVQANNSIVSCTIGDDQCLDWIEHTPTKGIASTPCFTLFGRLEDGAQIPFKILFSGVENGVSLVLKTDLSDYPASGLAEDSGFVVDVHSAFALPDVYSTGFLVAPRTSTRVAITTRKKTHETHPNSPHINKEKKGASTPTFHVACVLPQSKVLRRPHPYRAKCCGVPIPTACVLPQSKVQRRPHPYKSKCISSWRDTSFHPLLGAEDETFRSSHEKYTQRAKTFPKCGRRRWKCVEEQMKEADDWIKDCSCQIECE